MGVTEKGGNQDALRKPQKATSEELNAQLWVGVRRDEGSLATGFASMILLLTIYFAGLNAYLLYHAVPVPLQLTLETPAGVPMQGSYRAQLIWKPIRATAPAVRPSLLIDNRKLSESSDQGPSVQLGRNSDLRFSVPPDATIGQHEGMLLLTKTSGPDALPSNVTAPISIEVTGGVWRSWFLLKYWAAFSVVVIAGFYLFCVVNYCPPTGSLRVVRLGGVQPFETSVRLKLRPIAWLLPWRRSIVPLAHIWKKTGIKSNRLPGEIQFITKGYQLLYVPGVRCGRILKRLSNAPPTASESFGPADRMGGHVFTFEIDAQHRVEIQHLRPGEIWVAQAPWRS